MPSWLTHDNGGRPFRVEIKGKQVCVNKLKDGTDMWPERVQCYEAEKVFVGKSPLNKTTSFSGGHGKRFDGNSILLKLTGDSYVFIGDRVFEFSFPEPILTFSSTVGGSDVPYPSALTKNFALLLLAPPRKHGEPERPVIEYYSKQDLEPVEDWTDIYSRYYEKRSNGTESCPKELPIYERMFEPSSLLC